MPLHDIEAEALQLPFEAGGRLAGCLLQSLEPELQDTPENMAKAWDEEVARRIEAMDAGLTESIPHDQVRAEARLDCGLVRRQESKGGRRAASLLAFQVSAPCSCPQSCLRRVCLRAWQSRVEIYPSRTASRPYGMPLPTHPSKRQICALAPN